MQSNSALSPASTDWLSGQLRLIYIVGDPIAQVKSPAGVTQLLREREQDSIVIPAHVSPDQLTTWWAGVRATKNAQGVIITIPHKFAASHLCDSLSDRATFLGAANTLRVDSQGRWHGDMFDGLAFVQAARQKGFDCKGKKILLVGAGGAGSAIAHAALTAGAAELAIHDEDAERATKLIAKLQELTSGSVHLGSANAAGFDAVFNASPAGMSGMAEFPMDMASLNGKIFAGCVVTQPSVTPFIAATRALGCNTSTGSDMFACVRELMVDFLLNDDA